METTAPSWMQRSEAFAEDLPVPPPKSEHTARRWWLLAVPALTAGMAAVAAILIR